MAETWSPVTRNGASDKTITLRSTSSPHRGQEVLEVALVLLLLGVLVVHEHLLSLNYAVPRLEPKVGGNFQRIVGLGVNTVALSSPGADHTPKAQVVLVLLQHLMAVALPDGL